MFVREIQYLNQSHQCLLLKEMLEVVHLDGRWYIWKKTGLFITFRLQKREKKICCWLIKKTLIIICHSYILLCHGYIHSGHHITITQKRLYFCGMSFLDICVVSYWFGYSRKIQSKYLGRYYTYNKYHIIMVLSNSTLLSLCFEQ